MDTVIAKPRQPSGYTWTIASRIGHALAEAEEKFGPRDTSYFFAGYEFTASNPQVWYPGDRRHIVIQLGMECIADMPEAVYQLSHEVIHLLSPTGGKNANNLEEGLATWFANYYTLRAEGIEKPVNLPCYKSACSAVGAIMVGKSDAIRRMRLEEPCIPKINEDLILKHCPYIGEEVAKYLASPFVRSK